MGGWVGGHVVTDPDLQTLHVFTGLEVVRVPERRAACIAPSRRVTIFLRKIGNFSQKNCAQQITRNPCL